MKTKLSRISCVVLLAAAAWGSGCRSFAEETIRSQMASQYQKAMEEKRMSPAEYQSAVGSIRDGVPPKR